jgi:predicted transcriptional regulator
MGMSSLLYYNVLHGTMGEGTMATLTIRLDDELEAALTRLAQASKRSKSDLVREMLRRQIALAELKATRKRLAPYAERAGYLTDEDFFRDFS